MLVLPHPLFTLQGKENILSFVGSVINLSERKFYWTFIPSLAGSPPPTRVFEFRLESVQNPVGAGCSRVLGVYRHIFAGTGNP